MKKFLGCMLIYVSFMPALAGATEVPPLCTQTFIPTFEFPAQPPVYLPDSTWSEGLFKTQNDFLLYLVDRWQLNEAFTKNITITTEEAQLQVEGMGRGELQFYLKTSTYKRIGSIYSKRHDEPRIKGDAALAIMMMLDRVSKTSTSPYFSHDAFLIEVAKYKVSILNSLMATFRENSLQYKVKDVLEKKNTETRKKEDANYDIAISWDGDDKGLLEIREKKANGLVLQFPLSNSVDLVLRVKDPSTGHTIAWKPMVGNLVLQSESQPTLDPSGFKLLIRAMDILASL